jgi:hypothetical protein
VNVADGDGRKGLFKGQGGKKGKEEKVFDGKVRISPGGGVRYTSRYPYPSHCTNENRYKWVFLAKSHVPLRTHVDHVTGGRAARDGEIGGFGCLFCAAEGAPRGWLAASNINSNASIMSNSTGSSGGASGNDKGTPVFGNVASFMAHLEMHRSEEGWPGAEMRGRMKCVVGKVASLADEWEVNFVPLSTNE